MFPQEQNSSYCPGNSKGLRSSVSGTRGTDQTLEQKVLSWSLTLHYNGCAAAALCLTSWVLIHKIGLVISRTNLLLFCILSPGARVWNLAHNPWGSVTLSRSASPRPLMSPVISELMPLLHPFSSPQCLSFCRKPQSTPILKVICTHLHLRQQHYCCSKYACSPDSRLHGSSVCP